MKRLWLIRVSVNASAVTPVNQNEFECCEDAVVSDGEKAWPLTGADAAPGWDWVEGYLRKWCRNGRRCTRLGARSKTYDGHRVRYMVWRDSWRGTQAVNRQDILMSRDQFSSWKTLEFNFHHVVSFTHTHTNFNKSMIFKVHNWTETWTHW